jgi:VWFA-related protein
LAGSHLFAQQSGESSAASFRVSTELVVVPTVVTDKHGQHVPGLTKDDFVLEEDGQRKTISVFEEVKTDANRFHRLQGQEGKFSNYENESGANHRLSIIVLDLINTTFEDLTRAQTDLIKFLTDAANSGEPICLLTLTQGGIHLIQNFTDDPKVLAAALVRLRESHPGPVSDQISVQVPVTFNDQLENGLQQLIQGMLEAGRSLDSLERKNLAIETVKGLEQITKAFGRLPGRKSLIWATSGFPYSLTPPNYALCEPACPVHRRDEVQPYYEELWRALNDAQMSIYSVDMRGLAVDPGYLQASQSSDLFTHPARFGNRRFDNRAFAKWAELDSTDTMQIFADKTGGKLIRHGNDLMRSFKEAVEDDSTYYVLGYYLDKNHAAPGWHKLSVALHRDGTSIRYRKGFLVNKPAAAGETHGEMQLALLSPLDFTGIPLTVSWTGNSPSTEPGKSHVQFDLLMSPGFAFVDESDHNHMLVDITAVAIDRKGQTVGSTSQTVDAHLRPASYEQIQQHGMTFRNALRLPPGEYTVRFAVRDDLADRVGSVGAPLTVTTDVTGNPTAK